MLIDKGLLDEVSGKACVSERKRMNFNFHESLDAKSQRMLNALDVGTIMPIHRHMATSETYMLLRGRLKVEFFDDDKTVVESFILDPKEERYGVNIPKGQWHTLEVLEGGTVIFECKDGPYAPLGKDDIMK